MASTAEIRARIPQPDKEDWGDDAVFVFDGLVDLYEDLEGGKADSNHTHGTGGVVFTICTSTTRPNPPALGMLISETDTGMVQKCTQVNPPSWGPVGALDELLADTGAALNQYALTPSPAIVAYSTSDTFYFMARSAGATRICDVASGRLATVTSGSAVVPLTTGTTTGLAVGMGVSGTGIPASTTIASIQGLGQLTLSANATASGSGVALTFTKAVTGTIAANGKDVTITSGDTVNVLVGMLIAGTGVPGGCLVSAVADSTHLSLSNQSTAGSGIPLTITIPVVELTLVSGNTTGLTVGWRCDGMPISRDATIAAVVDSTHLKLSSVPSSCTAQTVAFNSGGNHGASVVNISGLANKDLRLADGTALISGNVVSGGLYQIKYNGTFFVLLNPTTPGPGWNGVWSKYGTGTGTFTVGVDCPHWVTKVFVELWGASGGGGGSHYTDPWVYAGGNGGGGAYCARWLPVVDLQQFAYVLGLHGNWGVHAGASGTAGSSTTFGGIMTAGGGSGGGTGGGGGAGGTAIGGDINVPGGNGGGGGITNNGPYTPPNGGDSPNGGKGGTPNSGSSGGGGGTGNLPGGGGGGASGWGYDGANGADGGIRIRW